MNFNVHATEEFYEEFSGIVDKSADRERIYKKMIPLLQQLSTTPIHYLCKSNHFEKLKEYKDLYAMRIQTKNLNLRMLFAKRENGEMFLVAFEEIAGKRSTDYSKYAPLAEKRLKSI